MAQIITGIILAGGKSSRMRTDKGLIMLNGKTIVEKVIHSIKKITSLQFIVSNNNDYEKFGIPVFKDIYKEKGPAGGIYTALIHSVTPFNLICACDMPKVSAHLLKYLTGKIESKYDAIVPVFKNLPQPLCAVYSKSCINFIESELNNDNLKMQNIIKEINTKFVFIDENLPFYKNDLFININSINELNQIKKR